MSPRLDVLDDAAAVAHRFARTVADEIAVNNRAGAPTRLIMPVGPTAQYPLLAEICAAEGISWANVFVVTMDEYLDWQGRPIPGSSPLSFRGFFTRFLASLDPRLAPPPEQYVSPDPFDIDRVDRFVAAIGGIDTCYGGIGVHGHVAFNEPPISRFTRISDDEFAGSRTRVVALAPETIVMNATRAAGGALHDFPPMAVTIGMADILAARRIRLFCDGGRWQQEALHRAVHGPVESAYPVTLLHRHPDVLITADRATAAAM
ncbi:hypothetical protein ACL02O_20390 [Micromonospora sp. MS34]|uniref:hypothetical protein n=1 Tax=Micromonospora sp. MS34 TaxID=3385971 RepID=UPI0039A34000